MGSLDQHCSSPPFTWQSTLSGHQVSTIRDDTQAMDDPDASACAWCTLLTPILAGFGGLHSHRLAHRRRCAIGSFYSTA